MDVATHAAEACAAERLVLWAFMVLIQRWFTALQTSISCRGEQLNGCIVVATVFVVLDVFLLTGAAHLLAGG